MNKTFVREVGKIVFISQWHFVLLFFIFGLILGTFRSQQSIEILLSALSSPDLFFLLFVWSAIILSIRSVIFGPIKNEPNQFIQLFAFEPAKSAIGITKALIGFLIGIFPVMQSKVFAVIGLILLLIVSSFFMSVVLVFSQRKFISDDLLSKIIFKHFSVYQLFNFLLLGGWIYFSIIKFVLR